MSTSRVPVLLLKDAAGGWTALCAETPALAACAESAGAALALLRDYLAELLRTQPWEYPDLDNQQDLQAFELTLDVRPEYQVEGRRHPCEHTARVRVPCVRGALEDGMLVVAMPTLEVFFTLDDPARLRELALHYGQERLKGLTPRQLSRFLTPPEWKLEEALVPGVRARRVAAEPGLPALSAVAEPLGERALRRLYSRAWERDDELARLVARVGKERSSVLLVGEPGCGKTALLVSAARELERADGAKRRLWATSAGRLIAGMRYLGEWEERLEQVIEELARMDGVLCVDNLADLIRLGGHGPGDSLGAFLAPYLASHELRLVAEATPAELDACRRLLPALADALYVLPLRPMPPEQARRALQQAGSAWARNQRIELDARAPDTVHRLYSRFLPYAAMPGRAAAFLQGLVQKHAAAGGRELTPAEVLPEFAAQTGIPEVFLRDELALPEVEVLARLEARVLGQPQACRAAAGVVSVFKAGLNDTARPLAVLLFAGPTGVGKTELARALGEVFFGAADRARRLLRLDMSEYGAPGSAARLVEAPDGGPSEFIQRIRTHPFCVVLLDEIEKASPDVFDALMGMFDEGRLTDRFGRTADFRSAVIVMTSNLGAERASLIGMGPERGGDFAAEAARFFRPEFFNRLDAVVPFAAMTPEVMLAIAEKELRELSGREGLARSNLRVEWTPAVPALLAQTGFDRRYGARPLQRAVETLVVTPLARRLAQGELLPGATVRLDAAGARIILG
ncbi:MAG: ATP-dependent Clp protease ATP-binding subunit [Planctomycetes bacterium]|nr:ATP-dependent Clp protease ATP-binding subunit [Planctomycetota bacterium]